MRSILRIFTLLAFCGMTFGGLAAQFGVAVNYRTSHDQFEIDSDAQNNALENGFEVGFDYWFRLPKKRIEFLPTLTYGRYKDLSLSYYNIGIVGRSTYDLDINEFGFQFRTNIYLFDLATDCDCPTWGKQGPALHKGFYLQLAPGVSTFNTSATVEEEGFLSEELSWQTLFNLGVGAGIDFGISNLITITPQVNYRYYFDDFEPGGVAPITENEMVGDRTNIANLFFGLRVGIRLDKRRY